MSPIRPENRGRYPADWPETTLRIKIRAGWRCECEGECERETHEGRCPNVHKEPAYGTGSIVVLTTAHLNHTPEDCRDENLRAMCQGLPPALRPGAPRRDAGRHPAAPGRGRGPACAHRPAAQDAAVGGVLPGLPHPAQARPMPGRLLVRLP